MGRPALSLRDRCRGAGLTPFGYCLPQHMALPTANDPLIKARNAQTLDYSLRSSAWRGQAASGDQMIT